METKSPIHPAPAMFTSEQLATDPILHFFHFAHLPAALAASSRPFCELAAILVGSLPRNAERTVALRKLLEAKDAAVRANVGTAGVASGGSFFDRLKTERSELNGRIEKLSAFLIDQPDTVPGAQLDLLRHQKTAMIEYLAGLDARIENIEHASDQRRPGANIHGLGPDEARGLNPDYEPEAREVGAADPVRDGPIKFGD